MVDFTTAIKLFFQNYATFTGRSTRAEYWWIVLFTFIISFGLNLIGKFGEYLYMAFNVAILLPSLALQVRRLHDINLSGWVLAGYYLILIILCGWAVAALIGHIEMLQSVAESGVLSDPEDVFAFLRVIALPLIISFVLGIVMFVFMCIPSAPDNKYGKNPFSE